jgi:hypothetical protein
MRRKALGRALVCLVAGVVVVGGAPAASAASDSARRARAGAGYLASQQIHSGSIPAFSPIGSTADAVLSLVAAERGPANIRDALRYLERQMERGNVSTIGLQAKVVMAAVAAGRRPRSFGEENLVRAIRSAERPNGRYGAGTAVFDHALAMLALASAGERVSRGATAWLAQAQCEDAGWQFDSPAKANDNRHCRDTAAPADDFFLSDTNTTSLAIQALRVGAGGVAGEPSRNPFAFFRAIRDDSFGGWGYSWGVETTDANSTALVIQAFAARGRPLPSGTMAALEALQDEACGAWSFTWADATTPTGPNTGATIGAILGALRRPLPIAEVDVSRPAPDKPPCD